MKTKFQTIGGLINDIAGNTPLVPTTYSTTSRHLIKRYPGADHGFGGGSRYYSMAKWTPMRKLLIFITVFLLLIACNKENTETTKPTVSFSGKLKAVKVEPVENPISEYFS